MDIVPLTILVWLASSVNLPHFCNTCVCIVKSCPLYVIRKNGIKLNGLHFLPCTHSSLVSWLSSVFIFKQTTTFLPAEGYRSKSYASLLFPSFTVTSASKMHPTPQISPYVKKIDQLPDLPLTGHDWPLTFPPARSISLNLKPTKRNTLDWRTPHRFSTVVSH